MRATRRHVLGLTLATLAAAGAGAASAVAPGDAEEASGALDVIFSGPNTRQRVAILGHRFDYGGVTPRLEIDAQNPTRRERRFEYRVDWTDAGGRSAQAKGLWRTVFILPGETVTILSVAQLRDARNARFTIRETPLQPPEERR